MDHFKPGIALAIPASKAYSLPALFTELIDILLTLRTLMLSAVEILYFY